MEAQGYRENQTNSNTNNTKQTKKKPNVDAINFDILNKDCLGAMDTLSRKAVENARAKMKTSDLAVYASSVQKTRPYIPSNVFARPMLPKTSSKVDKISPRKESSEEKKDSPSCIEIEIKTDEEPVKDNDKLIAKEASKSEVAIANKDQKSRGISLLLNSIANKEQKSFETVTNDATPAKEIKPPNSSSSATTSKVQNPLNKIKSVVPIKFQRQGIDVMKNPLINQNIKEFAKSGMKTKILLIKPIKMKDSSQPMNSPLKFQTIKLKDQSNKSTGQEKSSDQVVLVKVPNVERNIVPLPESTTEKQKVVAEKPVELMEKPASVTDQNEIVTPPVAVPVESVNEPKQDNTDNSEVNLICDEEISRTDLNSSVEKQQIVETVENHTITSSNGTS